MTNFLRLALHLISQAARLSRRTGQNAKQLLLGRSIQRFADACLILAIHPGTSSTGDLLESECAFEGNDFRRIVDFKLLPKNYGVALNQISRNEAVFNPEYAPSQSRFPDSLLEKRGVFSLYCGKKQVYLLTAERDDFTFEDA